MRFILGDKFSCYAIEYQLRRRKTNIFYLKKKDISERIAFSNKLKQQYASELHAAFLAIS